MRARLAIGWIVAMGVLPAALLSTACYRERLQTCRDAMTDFSSFSAVSIDGAMVPHAGAEQYVPDVEYTISASTTIVGDSARCVAVHSELHDALGGLIETIDTPIRASIMGGVLTTTPMFHYHSGTFPLTVRATALGQTVEAVIPSPFSARDAGVSGDAAASADAALGRDAGAAGDAGAADAGLADAGADAGP